MNLEHEGFQPDSVPRRIGDGKWLKALLTSKRAIAAIASALVVLLGPFVPGIDQDMALLIVSTVVAWIVSDSVRPTDNVFTSRRFWAMVVGALVALGARYGINVDPEPVIGFVMLVVSWIVGEGLRPALSGKAKEHQKDLYRSPTHKLF
jgi:hypothetical protein